MPVLMPVFLQYNRFQLALWHWKEAGLHRSLDGSLLSHIQLGHPLEKKIVVFVLSTTSLPKSTENILFSNCMVRGFCCCHCWFGLCKIVPSTARTDKTQKSGHLVTIFCWGEVVPIPAHLLLFCFYFRKDSNTSLHLQKANLPSVHVHCITEEFSLPCK